MWFKFTNWNGKDTFINLDHYDIVFQEDGTVKSWPNSRSCNDSYAINAADSARLMRLLDQKIDNQTDCGSK